jgi:hypothetical protein
MQSETESEDKELNRIRKNNSCAFAVIILLLLAAAGLLIFIFAVLLPELGMTA